MTRPGHKESGNVFVFILLGVILFGALIYTFTSSSQQGISSITKQQANIIAGEILNYSQAVQLAVDRVRRNGCSESQISFFESALPAYLNAGVPANCLIFADDGGKAIYQTPPTQAGTATEWVFTGATEIEGAGNAGRGDLVIILRTLDINVCNSINNNLGIITIDSNPPDDATTPPYTVFVGSFANGEAINDTDADLDNQTAGCVFLTGANEHIFYRTLLER